MKTWFQHIMLLCNNQQKVVTNGYPDLCEYSISGGSVKSLDMQMLLYPFEEQFNRTAVKSIDHFIEVKPKFLSFIQFLSSMYQGMRKVLIDMPILLLISFCQVGLGHCFKSRTVLIASVEVKSSLIISQTGSVCELSKTHHHEFIFVGERHNLCKYCFSFIHSLVEGWKTPYYKTTSSNRKILLAW